MKNFQITAGQFTKYLISLGLDWSHSMVDGVGATAEVTGGVVKVQNFTSIQRTEKGYLVRLAFADYLNAKITDGFFETFTADQLVSRYVDKVKNSSAQAFSFRGARAWAKQQTDNGRITSLFLERLEDKIY